MRDALLVFGPSPIQRGVAPAGVAKVAGAMLDTGWDLDILAFRADRRSPNDPFFTELLATARIHETASLFGKPSAWMIGATRFGHQLLKQRGHRLLVSFAGIPWTHVTALQLASRRDLPWIAFYTDPWSNHSLAGMSPLRRRVERVLERRVLRRANAVVFTNPRLQEWVLRITPDRDRIAGKCHAIPYFFEPELYPPRRERPIDGRVLVRHMGTTAPGAYAPALLGALRRLKDEMPEFWRRLDFEFYGSARHEFRDEIERLGVADAARFLPGVPYQESLALMCEADILLLLGGTPHEHGGLGNATLYLKLVDYIGAARPIFALAGAESAVSDILGTTGGVCGAEDPTAIKAALVQFLSSPVTLDPEIRQRFSRARVYPLWNRLFETVIGEKPLSS